MNRLTAYYQYQSQFYPRNEYSQSGWSEGTKVDGLSKSDLSIVDDYGRL